MADRGYEILEDGRMVEVETRNLSEGDKGKNFLCCDNPRGVPCLAKLTLVVRSDGKNFFAARGQPAHKPFCKYNKSAEYRRLAHIDPTGAGDEPDTILARFNHESVGPHGVRRTSGDGTKEKHDPEEEWGEENRIIQRVPGRPNSLKELILMLLSLSEEDYYAGVRIHDFLVDNRSIRSFRRNGLDEGKIAIAVCAKTNHGRELRNGENSLVLVDGFYFQQWANVEKLLFVVKTTSSGKHKILEASKDEKIAILAKWHRHPERKDVFISEFVNRSWMPV